MNFNEDTRNDYFDGPDIPERPKEPKKPKYKPTDPRYWDEPEDQFEHLRPHKGWRNWKLWTWVALCAIIIGFVIALYIRMFSPVTEEATQYGYVEKLEKRIKTIDTYEGVILPYKSLMDTTRVYEGDFIFSTPEPEVAAELKRAQYANRPVRITYSVYRSAMPWRGESEVIVTKVDSVNEKDILPPDRQPATVKQPQEAPAQ